MKTVTAKARFLRISPRKLRLSTDLIVGKVYGEAHKILQTLPKKGADLALTLLESARANAVNNNKLEKQSLVVKSFVVNQGPQLKRHRPRSRGRAEMIRKPTSHATVILQGIEKLRPQTTKDTTKDKKQTVNKKDKPKTK